MAALGPPLLDRRGVDQPAIGPQGVLPADDGGTAGGAEAALEDFAVVAHSPDDVGDEVAVEPDRGAEAALEAQQPALALQQLDAIDALMGTVEDEALKSAYVAMVDRARKAVSR